MKILVAGQSGQVARSLVLRAREQDIDLVSLGRPDLDICDPSSIDRAFEATKPGVLINAAAYTAVDQAETDAAAAHGVNATAAKHLASASAERSIPIIHLSTDYVFDGSKTEAYTEEDPVAPLGVYGTSKLAGERDVAAANPDHFILRTAWVYSPFGKNFVKTMLRLAEARDNVGVVDDQMGNPTSALDIADALLALAKMINAEDVSSAFGTYHLAGTGDATWADLAEQAFEVSQSVGGPNAEVNRITSDEFPTPVQRPKNSRLNCQKLADTFGIRLPHWRDSSKVCVEELLRNKDLVS